MQPRVLLLDEPLSALDPFLRVKMREELKRLQRELGITFIHVTHAQDEAMALADLMVVMDNGLIHQTGSPPEVFDRPASAFVARFIGGHNVLPWKDATIAVRADQCTIDRNGASPGLPDASPTWSTRDPASAWGCDEGRHRGRGDPARFHLQRAPREPRRRGDTVVAGGRAHPLAA